MTALACVDALCQAFVVMEDALEPQDVRHEIVGEEREPVEILELRHAGRRQVGGSDLCPLAEGHGPPRVGRDVEERLPGGEQLDERDGGIADDVEKASLEIARNVLAEISQRVREQRNELVLRILAEHRGDLTRVDRCELVRRPRAGALEPILQPALDGEISGKPRTLANGRKPAGAEVDRIQREDERGAFLE